MLNLISKHIFAKSLSNPCRLSAQSLEYKSQYCFSKFFEEKDNMDIMDYMVKKNHSKLYRDVIRKWKGPLQKKQLRRQRMRPIKAQMKKKQNEQEKLVLHNAAIGIQYPPHQDQIFCIVKVDGRQYKVTNDCVIVLDTNQTHQLNKDLVFEEILLVGTKSYTIIGRPFVYNARVNATIESISQSQKVIVFKKKRRQGYKKSFGSRNLISTCRINSIVHQLTESVLSNATAIQ